jgi:hypothetical protein
MYIFAGVPSFFTLAINCLPHTPGEAAEACAAVLRDLIPPLDVAATTEASAATTINAMTVHRLLILLTPSIDSRSRLGNL